MGLRLTDFYEATDTYTMTLILIVQVIRSDFLYHPRRSKSAKASFAMSSLEWN